MFSKPKNKNNNKNKRKRNNRGQSDQREPNRIIPASGYNTFQLSIRSEHEEKPEFQEFYEFVKKGIPALGDSTLGLTNFLACLNKSLCKLIDKEIRPNEELLKKCMQAVEFFRIQHDENMSMLEMTKGINTATLTWIVILHFQFLLHQVSNDRSTPRRYARMITNDDDEEEEGVEEEEEEEEWDPFDSAFLRNNLLCTTRNKGVNRYSHGEIEVALQAMRTYMRDVQTPSQDLVKYLNHLERRIAVLAISPSTSREVYNCGVFREVALFERNERVESTIEDEGGGGEDDDDDVRDEEEEDDEEEEEKTFSILKSRLLVYAAMFSSFRTRLNRYYDLEELDDLIADPSKSSSYRFVDKEYERFKRLLLEKARGYSTVEYMSSINNKITMAESDLCEEKICQYLGRRYVEQKDLVRYAYLPIVFRRYLNIVESDDFRTTLKGCKNMAQVIEMKHEIFGESWRNDLATIDFAVMMFAAGLFSPQKPKWVENFVFFERKALPEGIARLNPVLVQRFGRFDLLFGTKIFRARSALKSLYMWFKLVWKHPNYKGRIANFVLSKHTFAPLFGSLPL